MAVPIVILYEVGIWTSRILDKKKKPAEDKTQEK
jgi:Sec-independent protein secretion pathway component TatC